MEEKYLLAEELREERNYQRRPQLCGLFFSENIGDSCMKYSESLKKNRDFQNVYKTGKSMGNKYLVMYIVENQLNRNRLGISVSKKVGNSVVRHRVKRLILESYRLHEDIFNSSLDMVIIARATAKDRSYGEISSAVIHLGKLHGIVL